MNFSIVVAIHSSNRAIGSTQNTIPWNSKEDMRYFRKLTMHTDDPNKVNAIIMGSNTWKSIGCKSLPNRLNVVLSRNMAWMERSIPENVCVCGSLDEALHMLSSNSCVESVFVIGGLNVYEQALNHSSCTKIYLNKVHVPLNEDVVCNTFFPHIDSTIFHLIYSDDGDECTKQIFCKYNV